MGRRGRLAAAALAISAGLLLSACDGGEDPTDPPTTEPSSSEVPTEPATETTEPPETATPPEVEAPTPAPEAAVDDHVGAIYAARYFMDLYAYMRTTGDSAQFEAMSASECEFCAGAVDYASELHEAGGWVEGGAIVFDVLEAAADYPTDAEPNYLVRFSLTQEPQVIHRGDGSTGETEEVVADAVVALQFLDGRFVVFGVNVE
ncbi:DUF6318 family protein [Pseudactinotalea terrae]|uniref:DUF6318 family protein n=1 Tax=Pseudactinotalea terrae TaxID=1743262 RepID=UPI0012E2063D|nr:DUF6318 family protein [Pseudactinotalea terrae]